MLCYYNLFYIFSAGIDFRRQNLTSTGLCILTRNMWKLMYGNYDCPFTTGHQTPWEWRTRYTTDKDQCDTRYLPPITYAIYGSQQTEDAGDWFNAGIMAVHRRIRCPAIIPALEQYTLLAVTAIAWSISLIHTDGRNDERGGSLTTHLQGLFSPFQFQLCGIEITRPLFPKQWYRVLPPHIDLESKLKRIFKTHYMCLNCRVLGPTQSFKMYA